MSVSFTNVTTSLQLQAGKNTTYAQLLKIIVSSAAPVVVSGQVRLVPPGVQVAEMAARLSIIAACDAATTTITLSDADKTLALSLFDTYYWFIVDQQVIDFYNALSAAA